MHGLELGYLFWLGLHGLGFGLDLSLGDGQALNRRRLGYARAAGIPSPTIWGFVSFTLPDQHTLTCRDMRGRQGFLAPRFGGL